MLHSVPLVTAVPGGDDDDDDDDGCQEWSCNVNEWCNTVTRRCGKRREKIQKSTSAQQSVRVSFTCTRISKARNAVLLSRSTRSLLTFIKLTVLLYSQEARGVF